MRLQSPLLLGVVVLILGWTTASSSFHGGRRSGRLLSLADEPSSHLSRSKTLLRIHRQAEDSYEEGGEYEYEEEGGAAEPEGGEAEGDTDAEGEAEAEEKPTSPSERGEGEGDGDEYYDGENYDNKNEEEEEEKTTTTAPTTTTTTTTTTTPPPPTTTTEPKTSIEEIEDEDHYEERYEEERRRYEQDMMRQQYEQTHGADVESVEESPEDRREHSEFDTHEEPEEAGSPETTTTTSTTPTTPPESEVPEHHEEEVDADNEIESEVEEVHTSVEIKESGRHDLERYSHGENGGRDRDRDRYNGERPEEDEEEYEDEDEEGHHEEVTTSTTTTSTTTTPTTTTTTSTTPRPDEVYGRHRDPYEYEVEPPAEPSNHLEEEEEYYEKSEEAAPTTTTTTTTPPPPPPASVENEIETEEEEEEEENHHGRYYEEGGRGIHDHNNRNRYEHYHEEDVPEGTTTTTTTTPPPPPPPPTTIPPYYYRPYEPDPESEYEESEEEDDEDPYGIYSRRSSTTPSPSTTTTTTPTTTTTFTPELVSSSENEISSESDEDRIDLNRYEISPEEVHPPKERVIIEEITPRIECFTGYIFSQDGQECVDLNECESSQDIDGDVCGPLQTCHNLPGSYKCLCPSGYAVDPRNPKQCRDYNECQSGNGGCDQDCINVVGSFYCACADDFDLHSDGRRCIRRPTTTTTTTSTTTTTTTTPTTTTTTPPPTTTTPPSPLTTRRPPPTITPPPPPPRQPFLPGGIGEDHGIKNCPTPPVPRGAGIAYLYCSRSPVGIHHRHSQLERRLLHDWAARRNRTHQHHVGARNNLNLNLNLSKHGSGRNRRNLLRRKLRQTTYSPGSQCELRCRPGFELKGQYTLHCNASDGTWQGTRTGFCQAIPKGDNLNGGLGSESFSSSGSTPSNEIPRLAPTDISGSGFRPAFVTFPAPETTTTPTTTFRPNYHHYQPPPPANRWGTTGTTITTTTTPTTTTTAATTTTSRQPFWTKPVISRRPYNPYISSSTPYSHTPTSSYRPSYTPSVSSVIPTATSTTTSTARNSYIHLTYRFKTPWIKCPDNIKVDLPPNQSTAYVVIPQPQTNVDWWRQVTAEPAWAKGLESETGAGKQRISFKARTSAPVNNTAECSFTLEVRDNEPPRVRECPESFSIRLGASQTSKPVMWTEPQFSDNVRIAGLKKSHEPGAVLNAGEHLINYEAKDASENKARCSFTITVLPGPAAPSYKPNHFNKKPVNVNTEGFTSTSTAPSASSAAGNPPKPEVHASLRNVVCYVGKKGRRIIFQSRVVPRGCSEMTVDIAAGDSAGINGNGNGNAAVNTLNTVTQGSSENSATSQISSVSFSSHDHPQQASAFSQSVSNGRNSNRLVHSTSSVTSGGAADGGRTSSRASSYAIAVSSSSRNFELPFLQQYTPDKQVYDEEFVVPGGSAQQHQQQQQQQTPAPPPPAPKPKVTHLNTRAREESGGYRYGAAPPGGNGSGKYFRHFDTWDTTTNSYGNSRE